MKALTDKIIENLEKACNDWINQEGNKAINLIFKDGIEYAIRTIKSTTEEAEFEEIARVMMKHLGEKYHINLINRFKKEAYPDTEADGIIFCGKCGKMK